MLDPAVGRQRQDAVEEISKVTARLVYQFRDYVSESDDPFQVSTFVCHIDAVDLHVVEFCYDLFQTVVSSARNHPAQQRRRIVTLLQIASHSCEEVFGSNGSESTFQDTVSSTTDSTSYTHCISVFVIDSD